MKGELPKSTLLLIFFDEMGTNYCSLLPRRGCISLMLSMNRTLYWPSDARVSVAVPTSDVIPSYVVKQIYDEPS